MTSGESRLIKDHVAGGASRLAALLLSQILPVFSVVAPCHPGAALRDLALVQPRRATAFLTAALAALVVISTDASTSKFFSAATQADFLKGDVENLSIDSQGRLILGPATELVYETSAPFLWAVTAGPDGSLFVGTGNEGKVFKIDPQGKGSLFFDSAELEAHALALAPNGGLYVGTSPDGKIYKIDRNGGATTFFDGDDKYIWAIEV